MSTITLTPVQTAVQSYASKVNGQFHKSSSHYIDLGTRLTTMVATANWKAATLKSAMTEFTNRQPNVKTWSDITLCRGEKTTLDKIVIDITLQRMLDIMHVANILDNFKEILVMPIQVYEDPSAPGKYVCWDGQHTAIVLYIIAKLLFNEDITKCEIPIVIYASHQKSEMRDCFITLNGTGKQPLDPIDIFHQKLFGVRADSSTFPDWIENEKKQQALENAGMFATNEKFGDTGMPGALSVMTELLDTKNYNLEVTQAFCKYFKYVCNSSRPVQPKESWMLYMYFVQCQRAGITLDDAYIRSVARALQVVNNGDFDATEFWQKAKRSYQDWFLFNKPNPDGTLWGITYPEKRIGLTMLVAQIKKTGIQTPDYNERLWIVPSKDLF